MSPRPASARLLGPDRAPVTSPCSPTMSRPAARETERVREAADNESVPVVSFAETLPDGEDYVSWMTDNITAISDALGS